MATKKTPAAFVGKSEDELSAMSLDELVEYNTVLSGLREAAGGAEREAIYAHALDVNRWVTRRVADREETIRAHIASDPDRAALHQTVKPRAVESGEGFFLGKER